MTYNILTPLFAYGKPRAAPSHFPYDHPTLEQIDAAMAKKQAAAAYMRECRALQHRIFGSRRNAKP